MPRTARRESASGYYHVMLRGNERRAIFLDDSDRKKYLELLSKHAADGTITVLAYCLMDNHLHLLVHDETKTLSKVMRSIGISYTAYFNKKNNRVGHLFQDRFRSEAIENEAYLFSVLRYIHQNPVKAKICAKAEEYPWSGDQYYRDPKLATFLDTCLLNSINSDKEKAVREYAKLMEIPEALEFIDMKPLPTPPAQARKIIEKELHKAGITDKKSPEAHEVITRLVPKLYYTHKLSLRQIAAELGIGKTTVHSI